VILTFKQFISESSDLDFGGLAKQIAKDCAPWLSQYRTTTLYRGMNLSDPMVKEIYYNVGDTAYLGAVRNDRKPKDMQKIVHNAFNKHFVSKVGVPLRSASLFVTKSKQLANTYGRMMCILPIGEFHYTWSQYFDDPYGLFVGNSLTVQVRKQLELILPTMQKKYKDIASVDDLMYNIPALAKKLSR
jgi:hypothetical protein